MSTTDDEFIFYVGDESKIVVENNPDKSIFKEVYGNVFKSIDTLLEKNFIDEKSTSPKETADLSVNNPNNIFVFVGDRGAGKTSCMMSVASMLQNNSALIKSEKKFDVLESTDPSFFEENNNILDVILGRLFKKFKDAYETDVSISEHDKLELLKAFEKVKKTLTQMGTRLCEESNIDQLLSLSASAELNKDVKYLVDRYLKFSKKQVLVIPVDDIDLHTMHAYTMVEQIRKYLIQKNVIVLMALKMEQLERVIVRHYAEHYNNMLERKMIDSGLIADMANKYLVKLIPLPHRFTLKSVEELANLPVIIKKGDCINKGSGKELKNVVTSLIFEKTRYLFFNSTYEPSLIIPRNLREIRHLMNFLDEMPEYTDDKIGFYNKRRFLDYFLGTWINNLSLGDQKIIQELFNATESTELNKKVVVILQEKYVKDFVGLEQRRVYHSDDEEQVFEMTNVFKKINVNYNVSIGDVFSVIRFCQNRITQNYDKAFVFALETLYSITLYELYNKKIDSFKKATEYSEDQIPSGTKRKVDRIPEYNVVVGGRIVNEMEDTLVEQFAENIEFCCARADFRIISLESIRKTLIKNAKSSKLNVVEFFALTTSRAYLFDEDELFRTKNPIAFSDLFTNQQKYVWFSIYAIFANLTSIKQCYDRIDKTLYVRAEKDENSLLNKIRSRCSTIKKRNSVEESYHSCCSIRNVDVLKRIFEAIKKVDLSTDAIDTLTNMMKNFASLNIPTYDNLDDDKEYYKINFKFLEEIVHVLEVNKTEIAKIYNATEKQTISKIGKIEKVLKDSRNEINKTGSESRGFSTRYDEREIYIETCIQKLNLNQSKELVSRKLRDMFEDRAIYRSVVREGLSHVFINWLKSVPVLD